MKWPKEYFRKVSTHFYSPRDRLKKELLAREDRMKGTGKKPVKKHGDASSMAVPDSGQSSLPSVLLGDIRSLIESARVRVAVGVNAEMVMLYWDIGDRIRKEILGDKRAVYGKQVVNTLSDDLVTRYGPGFARTNLFNMIRFALGFPGSINSPLTEWTIKLDSFQEYHLC